MPGLASSRWVQTIFLSRVISVRFTSFGPSGWLVMTVWPLGKRCTPPASLIGLPSKSSFVTRQTSLPLGSTGLKHGGGLTKLTVLNRKDLRELRLFGLNVSGPGFAHYKGLPTLVGRHVGQATVTDDDFQPISGMSRLPSR